MRDRRSPLRAVIAAMLAALLAPLLVAGPAAARDRQVEEYRLTVGDVVLLDFLDDDREAREMTISSDGRVQAPLVGGIEIAGLTLAEAAQALSREYVERQILVDPKLDLAIADYRPVFVLGDVKSPGSFPYQPNLSVVQAMGLAGGPAMALDNEEDRLLLRATLESDLAASASDIARQAVWAARLNAALAGRATISTDDLPPVTRPFLNSLFVDALMEIEERILRVEAEHHVARREALQRAITESEAELELIRGMAESRKETIRFAEEELSRGQQLHERGLKPLSDLSRLERQLASDESGLLQASASVSQSVRALDTLKIELQSLDAERTQATLLELQERQVQIEKLLAARRAIEDKLTLVASWSADAARGRTVRLDFVIRRRTKDGSEEIPANELTLLGPGDVLMVSLRRPHRTEG